MERNLNGKVIVITGASSGFGKGAALKMASMGANLVLAARRQELLDELAEECGKSGWATATQETDVSSYAAMQELYNFAIASFGKLDVWINNAGVAAVGDFTKIPMDDHVQVINTDLLGTLYGSYIALTHFIRKEYGTLINVASMIGRIPAPFYASYSAAKHGVLGLGGALRQELSERKYNDIHVCTVLPMAMDTPFFEHAANYSGHEVKPIPPVGNAEEVVDTIIDLIFSPKAEVAVGKGAGVFSASDRLLPSITEAMMAKNTKITQDKAPPAPDSTGNLRQPGSGSAGVHGRH